MSPILHVAPRAGKFRCVTEAGGCGFMRREEATLTPTLRTLCFAALAPAPPPPPHDDGPPSVTVTGTGEVSAPPDMANVSAGVVTESPRAADAMKANGAAMQKVFVALDAAGIERKHVQTSRFDVSPLYAEGQARVRGMPAIIGYRAANQVQVAVHGVDKVGAVLDALVGAGANEVGGISFGIAEPAPLLDEARRKAIADARRKAELFASAAGVALGRVTRIDEVGGGGPVPVAYGRMMAEAAAAPVAPGQLDLSASVTVRFAIAP
jgi:uncharacterized protein YggE